MKKFLDKYIYLSQPIMLLITLISNFVSLNYSLAGNIIGYSILSNLVFFYLFNYKGNYCWFTKRAPLFLICINLIDIIGCYISYEFYSKIFNISICLVSLLLFLISKIKSYD
jgi:hypothetical protein